MNGNEWLEKNQDALLRVASIDRHLARMIPSEDIIEGVVEVRTGNGGMVDKRLIVLLSPSQLVTVVIHYSNPTVKGAGKELLVSTQAIPLRIISRVKCETKFRFDGFEWVNGGPIYKVSLQTDSRSEELQFPPGDCTLEASDDYRRLGQALYQLQVSR